MLYLIGKFAADIVKKEIDKLPKLGTSSKTDVLFLGENVTFCEKHSCRRFCGMILSKCSCHVSCITFNSCCYDFGKVCNITSSINGTSDRNDIGDLDAYVPPMKELYLYFSCEPILDTKKKLSTNYYQVTRCPNDTDIETKSLCEDKPSGHDLSRFVTVSTNESLYRNIYCARCHGIKHGDVYFWEPDFKCPRVPPKISSMKDYIKYLLKFCLFTLSPPLGGLNRNAAKCSDLGIATCPRVRADGTVNTEAIMSACARYNAPFENPDLKNPHCGICNGYTKDVMLCPFGTVTFSPRDSRFDFLSFSLLMDFTSSSGVTINSKFGGAKSLIICSPEKTLIGGECVKPNITTSCLPQMRNESDRHFYINLNITLGEIQFLDNVTKRILSSIASELPGSLLLDNPMSGACYKQNMTAWKCSMVYRFTQSRPLLIDTIEELLTYYEYVFQMKYNVDVHLYLTNYIFSRENICKFGALKTYSMKEVDVVLKGSDEYLIIKSNQSMYRMNEINIFVSLIPSKENRSKYERGYWVSVCETELQNCSKIYFEPDGYTINSNGDIVIHQSDFMTSRYEVCDGRAIVCSDLLETVSLPRDGSPGIQGELTLVGNCISEAFLAYTLVVHVALPSLRTVPGRCVMALSLSLFLAQLMFQLSSLAAGYFPVCVLMACLQHYFWLTSFCWMTVLAFDLSSTFSGGGTLTDSSQKEKKFKYFNVYAWCVPIAIVITSLVLQFANGMSIYANELLCWVNGIQNLLIFFISPLAITLCCNLVFFIRCVIGIVLARKITQKARRGSKLDLLIYVKLSSLMGFTWISGFLANAVQIEGFWYVFIVCNTLQGVAIGVTFAMSPRVLKMLRVKCGGRKVNSQASSTFTNISNTKTN